MFAVLEAPTAQPCSQATPPSSLMAGGGNSLGPELPRPLHMQQDIQSFFPLTWIEFNTVKDLGGCFTQTLVCKQTTVTTEQNNAILTQLSSQGLMSRLIAIMLLENSNSAVKQSANTWANPVKSTMD